MILIFHSFHHHICRIGVSSDDPCTHMSDGNYPIRDVFKYLICKAHKATYGSCKTDEIFAASSRECVKASLITQDHFCADRTNGNWRNPWDCHRYLACNQEFTYNMPCQDPTFVYNPETDQCVRQGEYACKQVSGRCGVKMIQFLFSFTLVCSGLM